MSVKPVIPRAQAERDIGHTVEHYVTDGGEKAGLGFIDALEFAFAQIARHPASGSPRYAHELDLPGLRFKRLKRYPYLVFYAERGDHVDVWRVLHEVRDIPEWMREPEGT